IIMEAAAVEPSGLLSDAETMMAGYLPRTLDGYRQLKRLAAPYGAAGFRQLFSGGRAPPSPGPPPGVGASAALPSPPRPPEPRARTAAEVEGVIEAFERCAAIAAEGGLDGIEISAAHNYLPAQFFTPETNDRQDRFAEPARFLTEVIAAVRRAAPGLALGVRLTADAPAARAVAPGLAGLIDFVHLTVGDS